MPTDTDEGGRSIAALIEAHPRFTAAFYERDAPRIQRWLGLPPSMGARRWPVPPLDHLPALAHLSQATRQRLCGLVVNVHPNVPRDDYDRLKAILTNCRRDGASSQNREDLPDFRAHLQGRVAWVESVAPARGARLRALFEAVDWAAGALGVAQSDDEEVPPPMR